MNNLSEKSKNYYEENDIYEIFSISEDYPNKIGKFLQSKILNKTVLDVGCGTGKFLEKFSKYFQKYYGLDLSLEQIKIAMTKANNENIKFICSSAENIPLENNSVDVIICTWMLGTILEEDRRNIVLKEMKRVVKNNGYIYLVENDIGGEFEEIRGRFPNASKTLEYNNWIETNEFNIVDKFETYFKFKDKIEAKDVFNNIWGDKVGQKIDCEIIKQNIIIYEYVK